MGCAPNDRPKGLQSIRKLPIDPPVKKADSVTSIQTTSLQNIALKSAIRQKWIDERETANFGKENKQITRFPNQEVTKIQSNPSPADLKGVTIQEQQKVIQAYSKGKEVTAMRAPSEMAIPYFESEPEVEPGIFNQAGNKQTQASVQFLKHVDLKVKANNPHGLSMMVMDFTRKVVMRHD